MSGWKGKKAMEDMIFEEKEKKPKNKNVRRRKGKTRQNTNAKSPVTLIHNLKEYRKRQKETTADVNQAEDEMIRCENLVKIYKTDEVEVMALQGLDLVVKRGELMAIIGNSGSGKSTLLNMIGGLAKPSAGRLYVGGKDLFRMSERELVEYKQKTVGFVWQNNARNLFPYLTAQQNVEVPLLLSNRKNSEARALELLELVDMAHKRGSLLNELSGGEQQRIAIAIALANEPDLLLADEPTGAVDGRTAAHILDLFWKLNQELGLTIVIVTHDPNLANKVGRVVRIRDGKISSEQLMKTSLLKKLEELGSLEDMEKETKIADIEQTHEEFAVLDRNGRIQLNQEMLDAMKVSGNNLKLELVDGKIVISNPTRLD